MSALLIHADLETLVRTWRLPMFRFARFHLQPDEEAEDAVQDALLALMGADVEVLRGPDPRRYVFGVLKHKVTDRLRRKYRADVAHDDAFTDGLDETLFDDTGHWALGTQNAVLFAINLLGVYRYMIRKKPNG